jgi:hypothetical protein
MACGVVDPAPRGRMKPLLRILRAGLIASIALAGTASAAAPPGEGTSGLQVVAPENLALSVNAGKHETEAVTIWLRNATRASVRPKFSAQLEDTDSTAGDVVSVAPEKGSAFRAVPGKDVEHYRVVLHGVDDSNNSSGELVISADGSESRRASTPTPATIGVTVTAERDYGGTYYWVLFGPAVVALLLVAIGWHNAENPPKAGEVISPANFSYSSGFASTLTVIGALLGTIIAAGILPSDTSHLAGSAYKALNIIFGALIASAVLIVSAFQKQTTGKDGSPELRAYVWAFMLACVVTGWAAFGELVTLWFLIWDVNGTSGLTHAGVLVLDILIVGSAMAMAVYVFRRIGQVASKPAAQAATTPTTTEILERIAAGHVPLYTRPAMRPILGLSQEEARAAADIRLEQDESGLVMLTPQPASRPPPRFVL